MNLRDLNIDAEWTLFLDRDGVINRKLENDYVKSAAEFEFLPGVPEALAAIAKMFSKVLVVSNQQGIGKGLMDEAALNLIHDKMLEGITAAGGRIDRIYFCGALREQNSLYRKPNIGMGLMAKKEFPGIRFRKSVMAGDSIVDMIFGKRLGMKTVLISDDLSMVRKCPDLIDYQYDTLYAFSESLA